MTTNRASGRAPPSWPAPTPVIERHLDDLRRRRRRRPRNGVDYALAVAGRWPLPPPGDPYSPWADNAGWRLNMAGRLAFTLVTGTEWRADLTGLDGVWRLSVDAEGAATDFAVGPVDVDGATITAVLDGRRMSARVIGAGESCYLFHAGREVRIEHRDRTVVTAGDAAVEGHLTAPMRPYHRYRGRRRHGGARRQTPGPGGDENGTHHPRAAAGKVAGLHGTVGEQVAEGLDLITFDAEEETRAMSAEGRAAPAQSGGRIS